MVVVVVVVVLGAAVVVVVAVVVGAVVGATESTVAESSSPHATRTVKITVKAIVAGRTRLLGTTKSVGQASVRWLMARAAETA